MAVFLAAVAALFSGTGDFLGGVASRRGRVMAVVAGSHVVGIAATFVVAPLVGGSPAVSDLWWGAAAGASGGVGISGLYLGFARSDVGIVSPIAAVGAAAWPVVFALATGERPGALVWVGLLLGVAAIVLISSGRTTGAPVGPGVGLGMLAGLGFGGLLILLSRVSEGAGVWPLAPARLGGLLIVAAFAVVLGFELLPARPAVLPMAGAGTATIIGNGSFILATQQGSLAVVSVVAAMFPAATVVLARLVWKEEFSSTRLAGLALALVAVALVAAG